MRTKSAMDQTATNPTIDPEEMPAAVGRGILPVDKRTSTDKHISDETSEQQKVVSSFQHKTTSF